MKIDKTIFLFIGLAVLVLWQGLLPGYIFGLDMVFGPNMSFGFETDGFLNGLIINSLIYFTSLVIPAWLIQKILLFAMFFLMGYLAYKYLPIGENKEARIFSALVYVANPFVYSRFLAGQWTHLMAYAFFPVLLYCLLRLRKKMDLNVVFQLFIVLFIINLFSIHYFVMISLIIGVYVMYLFIVNLIKKNETEIGHLFSYFAIAGSLFLLSISYWLIPAINRGQPLEQRISESHWEAFSAGSYNGVDVLLNVLSLNGFWGERNVWANYFIWPQDSQVFWIGFVILLGMMLIGFVYNLWTKENREKTIVISVLGIFSFVFALGLANTPFKEFNLWFFENISFWSGFRDTHKFSGILALCYCFFIGSGFVAIAKLLKNRKMLSNIIFSILFIVPIMFGHVVFGGFNRQMQSVHYPDSWESVKTVLEEREEGKVLFLPWHLYLSLDFNNKLITANPARRFFGERIISSKSVELGDIYMQEGDEEYIRLDKIVTNEEISMDERLMGMRNEYDIRYIIKINDLDKVDNWSYGFLNSEQVRLIYDRGEIKLYEILIDNK